MRNGKISRAEMAKQVIDDGTASGFTLHSVCAVLYRREVIERAALRFDADLKYNEDGLFNTEYFLLCEKGIYVDFQKAVYDYRVNPASASRALDIRSSKYLDNMKRIERRLEELARQFPNCDIAAQIQKRRATVALSVACYLAQAGEASRKNVKAIFDFDRLYRTYRLLDLGKMGFGKRCIVRAVSMRWYFIVALALRKRYGRK
jgi:hypothetical protein